MCVFCSQSSEVECLKVHLRILEDKVIYLWIISILYIYIYIYLYLSIFGPLNINTGPCRESFCDRKWSIVCSFKVI